MQLTSVYFLVFYLCCIILIRFSKIKYRRYILAAANVIFYISYGLTGTVFLLIIAALSYVAGIYLDRSDNRRVPGNTFIVFALSAGVVILMYIYHMSGHYYPVGMSFYGLMAVGYVSDVCMRKTKAIRNVLTFFICLSFFPIVISGPVENIAGLASELERGDVRAEHGFNCPELSGDRYSYYFLMILWGVFEKIVVSDISGLIVSDVFDMKNEHSWAGIVLATILFAFQLYADFDGYSNMAYGCAGLMGIKIGRNFRQPYLAENTADFWKRWHISLSTWLRDYIYIPLGGNRKGKIRKRINLMVTFVISGLWHGTGINYLVWGGLHGLYQVAGDIIRDHKTDAVKNKAPRESSQNGFAYKSGNVLRTVITFVLVDAAWFFFRAGSMKNAVELLNCMRTPCGSFSSVIREFAGTELGIIHVLYMLGALLMIVVTDLLRNRGVGIYDICMRIPLPVRWGLCYAFIFWIIFADLSVKNMGVSAFIYGQF